MEGKSLFVSNDSFTQTGFAYRVFVFVFYVFTEIYFILIVIFNLDRLQMKITHC